MKQPRTLEIKDGDNDYVEIGCISIDDNKPNFLISVITRYRCECNSVRITDAKDARALAAKLNECAEWLEKSK